MVFGFFFAFKITNSAMSSVGKLIEVSKKVVELQKEHITVLRSLRDILKNIDAEAAGGDQNKPNDSLLKENKNAVKKSPDKLNKMPSPKSSTSKDIGEDDGLAFGEPNKSAKSTKKESPVKIDTRPSPKNKIAHKDVSKKCGNLGKDDEVSFEKSDQNPGKDNNDPSIIGKFDKLDRDEGFSFEKNAKTTKKDTPGKSGKGSPNLDKLDEFDGGGEEFSFKETEKSVKPAKKESPVKIDKRPSPKNKISDKDVSKKCGNLGKDDEFSFEKSDQNPGKDDNDPSIIRKFDKLDRDEGFSFENIAKNTKKDSPGKSGKGSPNLDKLDEFDDGGEEFSFKETEKSAKSAKKESPVRIDKRPSPKNIITDKNSSQKDRKTSKISPKNQKSDGNGGDDGYAFNETGKSVKTAKYESTNEANGEGFNFNESGKTASKSMKDKFKDQVDEGFAFTAPEVDEKNVSKNNSNSVNAKRSSPNKSNSGHFKVDTAKPLGPIASTDDVVQVFTKVFRLLKKDKVFGDFVLQDAIYRQLQASYGEMFKDDSLLSLIVLLRLLESFQVFVYQEGITVPAPIFKIRHRSKGIMMSALAQMMIKQLRGKFDFNSTFTLQRKLRYIADAILKSNCNRSILLKVANKIFKDLCMNLSQKNVALTKTIKPYQELPLRKCKVDQFVPLKELGGGAFGKVYLCKYTPRKDDEDQEIRYVAVKTMKKIGQDPKDQGREAKYLIQNSYPLDPDGSYLVGCLCTFQTVNYVFVVMELMPGGSLFDNLRNGKIFGEEVSRKYAAQVFLAICDLHSRGILHRDIKPLNIVLDVFGNARLLDYGVSKVIADRRIRDKYRSYVYYPPEMHLGNQDSYGIEVDWYGFGVTIFECLVNKSIPSGIMNSTLHRNLGYDLDRHGISSEGKDLVLQLLNPDKSQRLMDRKKIQSHPWFASIDWVELRKSAPKMFTAPNSNNSGQYASMKPLSPLGPFADVSQIDPKDLKKHHYEYARFGKLPVSKK